MQLSILTFFFLVGAWAGQAGIIPAVAAEVAELFPPARVQANSLIELYYTLYTDEGVLLDSNTGYDRPAATVVAGRGRLLPGIEAALTGMRAGESKEISLLPEDAFGIRDPALVREVSRLLVVDRPYRAGDYVVGIDISGTIMRGQVLSVSPQSLLVDFNPDAAGKVIRARITVVSVDNVRESPE